MSLPSIESMLKAGLHFGHQASKWHPKMEQYIFGVRSNIHIIDLESTATSLQAVEKFINQVVERGQNVLFLGTKAQAKEVIEAQAKRANQPYVVNRWIGGFLTNFYHVIKLTKKLKDLTRQRDTGELNKYTKKEQIGFEEEIIRLETMVGGVKDFDKVPGALFIVDIKTEMTAVAEAKKRGIPIIALCDTNVNPDPVDYVIPGNDDAAKGIELIVTAVADMILDAQKKVASAAPKIVK